MRLVTKARGAIAAATLAGALMFSSSAARAEADTFGLGSGRGGTQNISGVINSYAAVVSAASAGATTVTVDTNAGFSPGDLVMVWQTAGASGTTGVQTALDLSSAATGQYEFARVSTVPGANGISFTNALVNSYGATGAQVVRVPEYINATINGSLTPQAWNGTKGGVLVFFATGTVTNSSGINADGAGFRGGVSLANSNPGLAPRRASQIAS